MLCRNKTKLLPKSFPGVYQLKCTCNSAYFGETKKKIWTRDTEHQQDRFKGKWDYSGATQHSLVFHGQFNWIHIKTIASERQRDRERETDRETERQSERGREGEREEGEERERDRERQRDRDRDRDRETERETDRDYRNRKIREALEIKKAKYNKKIKILNRDEGNLVKTKTWTPLLANISEM